MTVVANPSGVNYGNGVNVGTLGFPEQVGRQGDVQVSEVHGKYFSMCRGGNVFTTSVPAAGTVTLPTTLATLASKFNLINPAGSGVIMEILWAELYINSATEVANVIGFTKSTTTAAAVGTLTAGVINNMAIGAPNAGTSQAQFNVAATHADTPVWYMSIMSVNATAVGKFYDRTYFDGALILYPGNMLDMVTGVATQANSLPGVVWAEWPV